MPFESSITASRGGGGTGHPRRALVFARAFCASPLLWIGLALVTLFALPTCWLAWLGPDDANPAGLGLAWSCLGWPSLGCAVLGVVDGIVSGARAIRRA